MDLITLANVEVENRLKPISLTLKKGEMMGVIGANGSGKSTLLSCIAGIQDFNGDVLLNGQSFKQLSNRIRAQTIGYLPQSNHSTWALSVEDIVSLGRLPWHDTNSAAIKQALDITNTSQWRSRPINELSGGQQARVWLARVLAGTPTILLADEPIASLDIQHQKTVLQLMRDQTLHGMSVMVSIHDLSLAARFCDSLCLLHEGQLIALGTPKEVLTHANIERAFQVKVHIDLDHNPPLIIPS